MLKIEREERAAQVRVAAERHPDGDLRARPRRRIDTALALMEHCNRDLARGAGGGKETDEATGSAGIAHGREPDAFGAKRTGRRTRRMALMAGVGGGVKKPRARHVSGGAVAHGRSDRLAQLRAFCQVARLGSVTRAAEYVRSSQPAVSHKVRNLEEALGVAAARAIAVWPVTRRWRGVPTPGPRSRG